MPWRALQPDPSPRYRTRMIRDVPAGELTWWRQSTPDGPVDTRARLNGQHITIARLHELLEDDDPQGS